MGPESQLRHEMLGLRQIPQKRWKELSKRVEKSNGIGILLVHPYYQQMGHNSTYERTIGKLIAQTKIPVIVLEPHNTWKQHQEKYPSHVTVIPTEKHNPNPLLETEAEDSDYEHGVLAKLLEKIGVKKLRLGGMKSELGHYPDSKANWMELIRQNEKRMGKPQTKTLIAYGCLGVTYANLISSGKLKTIELIPPATFPSRPAYYKSTKPFPEDPYRHWS